MQEDAEGAMSQVAQGFGLEARCLTGMKVEVVRSADWEGIIRDSYKPTQASEGKEWRETTIHTELPIPF
jgi:hypothetical protein